MTFGIDKCKVNAVKFGKWQRTEDFPTLSRRSIQIPWFSAEERNRTQNYQGASRRNNEGETEDIFNNETFSNQHCESY